MKALGGGGLLLALGLQFAPSVPTNLAVGPGGAPSLPPANVLATSFTSAQGWSTDAAQFVTGGAPGCGFPTTFSGHQAGFGNDQVGVAGGGGTGCDSVILAANYPDGDGGRGFRHYRGSGGDNNNGGGMSVSLPGSYTEIWVAYRFRNAAGYGGPPRYTKDLYWHGGSGILIHGYQGPGYGFNTAGSNNYGGSVNWSTLYGSSTSDGSWHCYEAHHLIGASEADVWLDGALVLHSTAIAYSGFSLFSGFEWGENQSVVTISAPSPSPSYTDYDDLRIASALPVGAPRLQCPGLGG